MQVILVEKFYWVILGDAYYRELSMCPIPYLCFLKTSCVDVFAQFVC